MGTPGIVTRASRSRSSTTLVHQDGGCCNIRIVDGEVPRAALVDWADVVIGSPVFACDRMLDQTPTDCAEAVIDAFRASLDLSREEFAGLRRSNVLHEVLRYHDELAWLDPADPSHAHLARAVGSQLGVLVDFERSKEEGR